MSNPETARTEPSAGVTDPSGLRAQCLPFPEVLAQSVAAIAPTATPAANLPLVFALAGNGTWLAYLIAAVGMVLVGMNINQFARRSASAGSLYEYVGRGLGPIAGLLAGWALVLAYVMGAMATLVGFADYVIVLLKLVHISVQPVPLFLGCAAVVWLLAHRDVRLSSALMLALEFASIGLILVLGAIILFDHRFQLDVAQLRLEEATPEGVQRGLVLAVLSFVGFESATSLGVEARDPLRSIPRSVIGSTVISAAFFLVMAYAQVLGFHGATVPMNESEAPLAYLANQAGVPIWGALISIAAAGSFFACALGFVNAGARVLYSLGRHGILHPALGATHPRNGSPYVAVAMCVLLAALVTTMMSLLGLRLLEIYGYLGTILTFGFLVVYVLVSIAAPLYLKRQGALRPGHTTVATLSAAFMLYVIGGSVWPVPDPPYSVFPYLFLGLLLLGVGWFLALRSASPKLVQTYIVEE